MASNSTNIPLTQVCNDRHKKYSLRGRHQKHNSSKIGIQRAIHRASEEEKLEKPSRSGGEKEDPNKDLSLLASTFSDNSTFNYAQNAQNILEFNRVSSVKVIKTEKCIQDPVNANSMLKIASNTSLFHKKEEKEVIQFSRISHPNVASLENFFAKRSGQGDTIKLKNSAVFQNATEDNLTQIWKSNKSKFSLRKSTPLASTRSEFRVCLRYTDIRFPLRPLKSQELSEVFEFRQNLQKKENQNKFSRFLCSQFIRFGKYGCKCDPKCHWINRWLNRAEYEEIKNSEIIIPSKDWEATMNQIQKDIPRTQVNSETFLMDDYRQRLREVLVDYCKIDWEIGYVQGMNIVASIIVFHATNSFEALKVLELLMRQMNLRQIYASDLSFGFKVASGLVSQLKRLSFDLYSHLSSQLVDIKMFATSWYLSLMGAFVPLEWMHCIIEKFMRRGWSGINEIILALLLLFKEQLLQRETTEIMQLLSCRELQIQAEHIDWIQLIVRSDNFLLPPFQF